MTGHEMREQLIRPYIDDANGDRVTAAEMFARRLMRGDPQTFKAGYTAENALLTVVEAFGLTIEEQRGVAQRLGASTP